MAPRTRYSMIAIAMHWLIAILIFANIGIGWRMGQLKGLAQFELFQLHKSVGVSVLLLSAARVGWRLFNSAPPYPEQMSRTTKAAAATAHCVLYGFMFLLPLTGWIIVSASLYNLPTLLFKTLPWPHIGLIHALPIATRKTIEEQVGALHGWLAWSLVALLAFHVAAAFKHHLWDRDDVLTRMLPRSRRGSKPLEI